MSDGQVVIDITGDASRYRAAVSSIAASTKTQIVALGGSLQSIGGKITSCVTKPLAGAGTALASLAAVKGFNRLVAIDDARASLTALGHDADSVSAIMDNALAAVKGTSYGLDEAATVASTAVAAGVQVGDQLTKYLSNAADAASIAKVSMADMGSVFNKVQTGTKAYTEDLEQLADKGLPVYQWLGDELGISAGEVKEWASKGKISSETFFAAIDRNVGGAAKIVGELSWSGVWSNLMASIGRIGANFLDAGGKGGGFFSQVKPLLVELTGYLGKVEDAASDMGERFGSAFSDLVERVREMDPDKIKSAAGAIAMLAAAGPGLTIVGKSVSLVGAAAGPLGAMASGAASAAGTLVAAAKGAGDFASGILGAALPAAKDFSRSLAHGLIPQSAFDTAKQLSTDLAYGFRDAKNDIAEAFSEVKDKIASKFSGISEAVGSKIAPIKDKVGGLASVLGESARNAVDTFAAKLDLSGPAEKAKGALGKVGSAAKGMAKGAAVATGVLGAAATGILGLGLAAAAGGVDLQAMADGFVANMQQITANLPAVAEQAATILPSLVEQVVTSLPAFIDAIGQAFMAVVEVLPTIMPALVDGVTQLVVSLATMLVTMAPQLLDAGLQLFVALIEAFAEMVPQLTPMLPELVGKVVDILVSNAPALLRAGFTLFTALVKAFLQMLPQLISSLPQLISRVLSTVLSWLPSLGSAAGQLFGMIVQAVPGIAGALLGALGSLLGRLPGAVSSFAGSLASAGYNMLMGMVSGITSAGGAVWDAIVRVCSNALDAVKGFFGIHSPSRVLAAVGRYLPKGMAVGISDTAAEAVRAMRGMAADVVDAARMDVPAVEVPVEFDVPDFPGVPAPAEFALEAALERGGRPPSGASRRAQAAEGESKVAGAVERLIERVDRLDRGLGRKIADNSPDEVTIASARGARRALGVG